MSTHRSSAVRLGPSPPDVIRTSTPPRVWIWIAAILIAWPALAIEPVRQVYDSDLEESSESHTHRFAPRGDLAFIVANDVFHGREIWRTDGTPEGSDLLGDLCPGLCDARTFEDIDKTILEWKGAYYFSSQGQRISQGLWKSEDGKSVERLISGRITAIVPLEDTIVFSRFEDDSARTRLWVTDGTTQGTQRLGFTAPFDLQRAGDLAYFLTSSFRVWVTDGTANGTRLLVDLGAQNPITGLRPFADRLLITTNQDLWISDGVGADALLSLSGDDFILPIRDPMNTENFAFFHIYRGDQTGQLWRTDGTVEGTIPLPVQPEVVPHLTVFTPAITTRTHLFVVQRRTDDSWRLIGSDGTPEGTHVLTNLETIGTVQSDRFRLTALEDRIFLADYSPDGLFLNLWTSDGTPGGTVNVLELRHGSRNINSLGVAAGEGKLWFSFNRQTTENVRTVQIWQSDGTTEGTGQIVEFPGQFRHVLGAWNEKFFLTLLDENFSQEPWVSDGTTEGTQLLVDMGGNRRGLRPSQLTASLSGLYFEPSGIDPSSLWTSDGTEAGTVLIPELENIRPQTMIPIDERVLVFTETGDVWITDGTSEGTERLDEGMPVAREWARLNGDLYFLTRETHETTLWRCDGTAAGTTRIATINAGTNVQGLFAAHDQLFFVVDTGSGQQLWSSDGTAEGTRMTAFPFPANSPKVVGNTIYFTHFRVRSLVWSSDGTPEGSRTLALEDLFDGEVQNVMATGEALYFTSLEDDGSRGLWRSNGTAAGTSRIADLPGRLWSPFHPEAFVATRDRLFFTINTNRTGIELWTADRDGAQIVADICPGACSSNPQAPRLIADRLYFAAMDGEHGLEPWISDGTEEGTRMLGDVNPGSRSSDPQDFVGYAGEVFFSAHRADTGPELWAYDLLGDCPASAEQACLDGGRFQVSADWRSQHGDGQSGTGKTLPFSDASQLFWFFNPENVELVVKVLDGRTINGNFWFFYGALSDVEYWIAARDRLTGRELTFYNPPGNLCGDGEIQAFPEVDTPLTMARAEGHPLAKPEIEPPSGQATGCELGDTGLCLQGDRFLVEVDWRDRQTGELRPGQALPGTSESGYFWFFDPENLELIVKVLDGREINGQFWVYYGALSDVEYTITVTDTVTGVQRTYENPRGEICGLGDTRAFDG